MTKKERNVLYKRMLKELRKLKRQCRTASFCNAISMMSKEPDWYYLSQFDEKSN